MILETELIERDLGDCFAWFNRAIDGKDRQALADWAEKYGRSLCAHFHDDPPGDYDELEAALASSEADAGKMEDAIRVAIQKLDDVETERDAIDAAIVILEGSL